jgi:low affinity Fe/Cu permease
MEKNHRQSIFERFSLLLTRFTGGTTAFIIAFMFIVAWAISGPLFNYSDVWQLTINTATTIVTFLMVFLIQRTQNKDSLAIQLKLNELIAATKGASNRLVDVEDLSEVDLEILKKHYEELSNLLKKEVNLKESHSIEEAERRHKIKIGQKQKFLQ